MNIFKNTIDIDTRISFYSHKTHLLPPKPKTSFRHLKRGIHDFHMNYVLVPADKAATGLPAKSDGGSMCCLQLSGTYNR